MALLFLLRAGKLNRKDARARKVRKEKILGDSAQTRSRIERYRAGPVCRPGQSRQQAQRHGQCFGDWQSRNCAR